MSELEFESYMDDALPSSIAKGGASLRSHLMQYHKVLAAEHADMRKHFDGAASSLDDGHEAKGHLARVAEHHKTLSEHHSDCMKALASGSDDVSLGDAGPTPHGPKSMRDRIRPDGVSVIAGNVPAHIKLVPRGGSATMLEKATLDSELDASGMFDGI